MYAHVERYEQIMQDHDRSLCEKPVAHITDTKHSNQARGACLRPYKAQRRWQTYPEGALTPGGGYI